MAIPRRVTVGEWLVDYSDATEEVVIERTMTDILKAKPGDAMACMNSQCIKAQRNAHVFPHPVYAVSTIKTRVYIIDKLSDDGTPIHAVRYELGERDSRLIHSHDKHAVGEPGLLRLRIPRDPKGSPKRAAYDHRFTDVGGRYSGDGKASKVARPVTALGAKARVVVAVGAFPADQS